MIKIGDRVVVQESKGTVFSIHGEFVIIRLDDADPFPATLIATIHEVKKVEVEDD